jgi:capsular exopolysaccharide synthesis family protein
MSTNIIKPDNNHKNNNGSLDTSIIFSERLADLTEDNESTTFSDLKLILKRRWKVALGIAATVIGGTALLTFIQKPKYLSETLIRVTNEPVSAPIIPNSDQKNQPTRKEEKDRDLSTEIKVLRSPTILNDVVKELRNKSVKVSLMELQANLSIFQAQESDVLVVSYLDSNPRKAQLILEFLGNRYIKYSLEKERSQAANGVKFIKEKLPQARAELERAAKELRSLRQRYGIIDPDKYADELSEQKRQLNRDFQELLAKISSNQRRYQELSKKLAKTGQDPNKALSYSILERDSVYQDLVNEASDLQKKYHQERSIFNDNYPSVEALKTQLDRINKSRLQRAKQLVGSKVELVNLDRLPGSGWRYGGFQEGLTEPEGLSNELAKVETDLVAQKNELSSVRRTQQEIEQKIQKFPQIQQSSLEVEREFKIKSDAVSNFMSRLQDLQISQAQEIATWKILQPPYLPTFPDSPNIPRNLLLGLIAGGILSMGGAMLVERSDKSVKQVKEAKQITKLPLLGAIPKVTQPEPTVIVDTYIDEKLLNEQNVSFTEALRSLAMNLRYLNSNETKAKVLAVISARSSEGKSTLTYNLALVMAELGIRVLVVDSNMRNPGIHRLAQQSNESGLSTLLSSNRHWSEYVRPGKVSKFEMIVAGPTHYNPVALLNSGKMKQLINEWRQAYDYVLLDTPTIGITADVQTLVSDVDSVILVSGMEKAPRKAVAHAMEILRLSTNHLAGLVVNFVDKTDEHYDYLYDDTKFAHLALVNNDDNGKGQ